MELKPKVPQVDEPCCTMDISGADQKRLVEMFDGLANPVRFEIMKYLVTHEGCITGNIVDILPLAQSTVSQHLAVLEKTGWIRRSPEGAATNICLQRENIAWFREWIGEIF
jgi:ArsR family transcriptional regulator